jgi:hypothetical protein
VPVEGKDQPQIEAWLRRRNLARKYANLRTVEAQDWLLADPSLPSGTGSERVETATAVDLAVQLGLLRPDTNRRTWLGDWFVTLTANALHRVRSGDRTDNVFRIQPRLQLAAAQCAFSHDGDGLRFVSQLLEQTLVGAEVTVTELFSLIPGKIDGLVNDVTARVAGSEDAQAARRIRESARLFAREAGGRTAVSGRITKQTQRRLFEDFLYWRLETLVDLGLLAKRNKDQYAYTVLPNTQGLNDVRLQTPASRRSGFFKWWGELFAGDRSAPDSKECFDVVVDANDRQSNSMGYSLIEEAATVANTILLERGQRPFIDEDDIIGFVASPPAGTRIVSSVDRNRRVSAFKVTQR